MFPTWRFCQDTSTLILNSLQWHSKNIIYKLYILSRDPTVHTVLISNCTYHQMSNGTHQPDIQLYIPSRDQTLHTVQSLNCTHGLEIRTNCTYCPEIQLYTLSTDPTVHIVQISKCTYRPEIKLYTASSYMVPFYNFICTHAILQLF